MSPWTFGKIASKCDLTPGTLPPSSTPSSKPPTKSPSKFPTLRPTPRPSLSSVWYPRGFISGDSGEKLGFSVGLTNDGNILGVGGLGILEIYEFQHSTQSWVEVHRHVTGNEKEVNSLSFSSTGDKMVFGDIGSNNKQGSALVLSYNSAAWSILTSMVGEAAYDQFGYSVSITGRGDLLTIGTKIGYYCKVFALQNNVAVEKKKFSIENEHGYGSGFGESVSMAQDGSKLIVGAPLYKEPDSGAGLVRFYDLATYEQIYEIKGRTRYEYFGQSVSMSNNGSRVVVSAFGKDTATIYSLNSVGDYLQLSDPLGGDFFSNTDFGCSVSISGDGTTVAVGAKTSYANELALATGVTFVYAVSEDGWSPMRRITSEKTKNLFDYFGWSVASSADGSIVAIGARGYGEDNASENYGIVATFES